MEAAAEIRDDYIDPSSYCTLAYTAIYVAFSANGYDWIGYDMNGSATPIFGPSCGELGNSSDAYEVNNMVVIRNTPTDWEAFYTSLEYMVDSFSINYATSVDGINWVRSTQNPLMAANEFATWRNHNTGTLSVVKTAPNNYLVYFFGSYNTWLIHSIGLLEFSSDMPVVSPSPEESSPVPSSSATTVSSEDSSDMPIYD